MKKDVLVTHLKRYKTIHLKKCIIHCSNSNKILTAVSTAVTVLRVLESSAGCFKDLAYMYIYIIYIYI